MAICSPRQIHYLVTVLSSSMALLLCQVQLLHVHMAASRSQQDREANSCESGGEGESDPRYPSTLCVYHIGSAKAQRRHCSCLERSTPATSRHHSDRRTVSTQSRQQPHSSSCSLQSCNCLLILASPRYHAQQYSLVRESGNDAMKMALNQRQSFSTALSHLYG